MDWSNYIHMLSNITNVPVNQLKTDTHFRNDLGIDSLHMVNIIMQLAEQTNGSFDHFVQAESLDTVGHVYQILQKEEQ
ncbi:hypothetical protein J416_05988 [Gracilibacillus halophilus YIM-C55.5]|uniref:Carrier domain-containing protein n=1 Tax=Gracilibacillus halophilus YIM-C55.5 TaxID=1308866 RepID=N4WB88_9BACI|nr:phosphopantetheine-binding protein [Gracilibacillus halophilus]ENH97538.1 hypothetical protein J416_05988 [Gracilibacillus halophilus YIM-C55.5]